MTTFSIKTLPKKTLEYRKYHEIECVSGKRVDLLKNYKQSWLPSGTMTSKVIDIQKTLKNVSL